MNIFKGKVDWRSYFSSVKIMHNNISSKNFSSKYIFSSRKHKNMQDLARVFLHWVEKKSYLEEKLVELFGEVAIPFAFFLLPFLAKAEIILIKVVTLVTVCLSYNFFLLHDTEKTRDKYFVFSHIQYRYLDFQFY